MKKQDDTHIVTGILSNNRTTVHVDNLTCNINVNVVLLVIIIIFLVLMILTLAILCLSPELRSIVIHFLLNIVKQN